MTPEEIAKALRDLAFLQLHEDAANLIEKQAAQLDNCRTAKNLHARREQKLMEQVASLKEIAIEERAKYNHARSNLDSMRLVHGFSFSVPMFSDLSEVAKANRIDTATCELAAEAGNWRKIGLDEQKAIQYAIDTLRDRAYYEDEPNRECIKMAAVLRKLLEGLP